MPCRVRGWVGLAPFPTRVEGCGWGWLPSAGQSSHITTTLSSLPPSRFPSLPHDGLPAPEAPDRPTISMASETSVYVTWIPPWERLPHPVLPCGVQEAEESGGLDSSHQRHPPPWARVEITGLEKGRPWPTALPGPLVATSSLEEKGSFGRVFCLSPTHHQTLVAILPVLPSDPQAPTSASSP